jgi:hypothetical protein
VIKFRKTPKNPKKPRKIRIWTKLCVKFGLPYPETEDAGRGTPWMGHHVEQRSSSGPYVVYFMPNPGRMNK